MAAGKYSREQFVNQAQISQEDLTEINQRRQPYTRLGFAYQLAFVRSSGARWARFPIQQPFELDEEILVFVSLQLDIPSALIHDYLKIRRLARLN